MLFQVTKERLREEIKGSKNDFFRLFRAAELGILCPIDMSKDLISEEVSQ